MKQRKKNKEPTRTKNEKVKRPCSFMFNHQLPTNLHISFNEARMERNETKKKESTTSTIKKIVRNNGMKKGLSPRDSLQCIGSVGNNGRRSTPHNQTKLNKNIIIIMWCGEHELSNRRNVCMDCVFVMLARTLLVCTNIPSLFSYTFMLLLLFTHTDF